jgi:hypothetical protein
MAEKAVGAIAAFFCFVHGIRPGQWTLRKENEVRIWRDLEGERGVNGIETHYQ